MWNGRGVVVGGAWPVCGRVHVKVLEGGVVRR